jgi:hypothetical protein
MALLQAHNQNVEISSVAINSLVNALGPFKNNVRKLLAKQGIEDLTPGKWYPQQAFLDAFKNLPSKVGDQTVIKVGMNLARNLKFPPDIDSIGKALSLMNVAYQEYYRNGDIGNYKFRETGERECTMFCSSPYPCAFDQGVLTEICNRYKPVDSERVSIEHSSATGCRQTGGLACTYIIRW